MLGSPRFLIATMLLLVWFSLGCQRGSQTAASGPATLPDEEAIQSLVDGVLDSTLRNRQLSCPTNGAWQIMHGVLAYGRPFEILLEHENRRVQAVDWLLAGGNMPGWIVRRGEAGLKAELQAGTRRGQGHEDQWLAVLAQCDLASDHPIIVGDEHFTMGDLVSQAMFDVYEGKECSWTLIGLSAYLPLDTEWQNREGETWTLERVVAMEASQDLTTSACGGSHRLIGMQMALDRYRQAFPDRELSGGWAQAQSQIDWAVQRARQFQQPSGAFSVNYFERASNSVDAAAHLGATGHTLEFLSLALSDEKLQEPWVTRSVVYLCDLFEQTAELDLECGALYHAVHGLQLYRARRFGPRATVAVDQAVDDEPAVGAS